MVILGQKKCHFDFVFVEFKGALAEQYVLQQIICDTNYTPYYFGTDKATFEQDFMIQKENDIVPIVVKASTNVRSQSLKTFYDKYNPKVSIRFSLLPYCDQSWMINIPLFAVCNLYKKRDAPTTEHPFV